MWNELGISGGTAILILIALYYVIKWAVKNGIKEAYRAITGEKTNEDLQNEKELEELGSPAGRTCRSDPWFVYLPEKQFFSTYLTLV